MPKKNLKEKIFREKDTLPKGYIFRRIKTFKIVFILGTYDIIANVLFFFFQY